VARLAEGQLLVDALQRTLRVGGQRLAATEMGSAYASATREALVGGDVLDAWRAAPDRGWFLIADATGRESRRRATRPSPSTRSVRSLPTPTTRPSPSRASNRLFLDTFEDPSVFVVVFLGTFDARSQTLRYASAGHGTRTCGAVR